MIKFIKLFFSIFFKIILYGILIPISLLNWAFFSLIMFVPGILEAIFWMLDVLTNTGV